MSQLGVVGAVAAALAAVTPALERVEVGAGDDGRIRLVFVCQTAPGSYRVGHTSGSPATLEVHLGGYRSQVPPEIPLGAGLPDLEVSEDQDGVRAEVPATAFDLDEVRQEGARLMVALRPRPRPIEPGQGRALAGGALDASYRVGPGDLLAISVFGHEDLSKSVRILSNGTINFPLLGDIAVSGMTPAAIAGELKVRLERDYVVNPQVLVGVSEYLSQPVNVIGEVQRPGKYFLRGPTRLIDILSEAGGLSDSAGFWIIVTRYEPGAEGTGASRQMRISTEALFAADNEKHNVPLMAYDVVRAQPASFFYISGEVGRPGQYPLRPETTIQKAISLAGGFSQWADEKDVQLIRDVAGEKKKFILNVRKIGRGQAEDVKIQAEDIIVVSRRIL